MGYLHITNLYKDQDVLRFKECYALEKVHGTSASISWDVLEGLNLFSGGESQSVFAALFDNEKLSKALSQFGAAITVYGEAYGGKCQGMKETYGHQLKFIVFDIKVGDVWLDVPTMSRVTNDIGLVVVPWSLVPTDIKVLDALRDAPSVVAEWSGCPGKPREGIVIRPPIEVNRSDGSRVIAKHKASAFNERTTHQSVVDSAKLQLLQEASAIAEEWVTAMRLEHVLDKLPHGLGPEATKQVIAAMVEDVTREAKGEIVDSKEARDAIGRRTSKMFLDRLKRSVGV